MADLKAVLRDRLARNDRAQAIKLLRAELAKIEAAVGTAREFILMLERTDEDPPPA